VHTHNLSSFLYSKCTIPIVFTYRRSFSPLFSVGLVFGLCSHTRRCRLSFIIALAAPCPRLRPCVASIPSLPLPQWYPLAGRTHVRTASTLLQLPMVIHHHPTHRSNNTTVFPLPPARCSLVLYVLLSGEQSMESEQMLNFHVVYD
jgi:hypothetical protein